MLINRKKRLYEYLLFNYKMECFYFRASKEKLAGLSCFKLTIFFSKRTRKVAICRFC